MKLTSALLSASALCALLFSIAAHATNALAKTNANTVDQAALDGSDEHTRIWQKDILSIGAPEAEAEIAELLASNIKRLQAFEDRLATHPPPILTPLPMIPYYALR